MPFTYYVIKNEDIQIGANQMTKLGPYRTLQKGLAMYMVQNPPKYDDVISEQPLTARNYEEGFV